MMQKFILSFIFMTIMSAANAGVITYADFVHQNPTQQRQTIKLVHKYLTEYEYKLRVDKVSQTETKKYHSYLNIFKHFIQSAHAEQTTYSSENISADNKCYYAGWTSLASTFGSGAVLCRNPRTLAYGDNQKLINSGNEAFKNYFTQVNNNYKNAVKTKSIIVVPSEDGSVSLDYKPSAQCQFQNDIICNPQIYGQLNKDGNSSTLCIKDGNNQGNTMGLNVSLLCEKALEKMESDKPEDFKLMVDSIIKTATGNPKGDFFETVKTMYSTCLCGGAADSQTRNTELQGTINPIYAQRIFASRTCTGILRQTERIKNSYLRACFDSDDAHHESFSPEWVKYFTTVDSKIGDYLDKIQDVKFNGTTNQAISAEEKNKYFQEDFDTYGPIAHNIYEKAKENGLCPVDPGVLPSVIPPVKPNNVVVKPEEKSEKTLTCSISYIESEDDKIVRGTLNLETSPHIDKELAAKPETFKIKMEGAKLVQGEKGFTFEAPKEGFKEEELKAEVSLVGIEGYSPASCTLDAKPQESTKNEEEELPENITCEVTLAESTDDNGKISLKPEIIFKDESNKELKGDKKPPYFVSWFNSLYAKGTGEKEVDADLAASTVSEGDDKKKKEKEDEEKDYKDKISEIKGEFESITNKKATKAKPLSGLIRMKKDSIFYVVVEPQSGAEEAIEGTVSDDTEKKKKLSFKACHASKNITGTDSIQKYNPARLGNINGRKKLGGFLMMGNR